MAHYAIIDPVTNLVEFVHPGRDENDLPEGVSDWEQYYAPEGKLCKRTSYNTFGGVNLVGGNAYRKNFAGVGYLYDEERDAFIPPKPFASWILDEDTCLWSSPIPYPNDGLYYEWNEEFLVWVLSENEQ